MSTAIRDHINGIRTKARALAMQAMLQPKSERDYLLACGKVQRMVAEARELEERFLEPEQPDPEQDLPDTSDYPEAGPAAPPRRAVPQRDRVDASRARHRPRQM